jgi:hypothetical protein
MLSCLFNRFEDKGIEHFTLNFVVNNSEAEQAWQALGFTPTIVNCAVKINTDNTRNVNLQMNKLFSE